MADADFSVRLMFRNRSDSASDTVFVDAVRLTVHYVTVTETASAQPSQLTQEVAAGEAAWTGLEELTPSGTGAATVAIGPRTSSPPLVATGFGLSLPPGKVPLGVLVKVEREGLDGDSWLLRDADLRLVVGGAPVGLSRGTEAQWSGEPLASYGGASDLWDAQLSASDVARADFGVQLAAYNTAARGQLQPLRLLLPSLRGSKPPDVAGFRVLRS